MRKIQRISEEIENIEKQIMQRNDNSVKAGFYSIISKYNISNQSVYDGVKTLEIDKAYELLKDVLFYNAYVNIEMEE